MKFKSKITGREYAWGIFFLKYKSPWSYIIPPLVIGSYAVLAYYTTPYSDKLLFIVIFSVLMYVIVIPWMTYSKAKKAYNNYPVLHEEIEFEFTHDYVKFGGPDSPERNWTNIYEIEEIKHCFLIYVSKKDAHLIPKNSLTNDEINKLRGVFRGIDAVIIKKLKD